MLGPITTIFLKENSPLALYALVCNCLSFSIFYCTGESGPLTEHAVVLVRCYPQFLEFMNFWGQDWANGGFFRVKDAQVFQDMTFFDIFWENDDLTPKERNAYKAKALANAQKLHETFPSVGELLFQCPLCKKNSRVNDYNGHFLLAECPKCWRQFKPTYEDLGKVLYLRNM